ncbi:hypothetical protein N7457_001219 [Penicillium paradoxum]|uniref:uncharacterized protein n=1 Tax=Penicillium paradoxum TaxID=176176 RepID=UPI0025465F17|nr:uncharacterized protein N7457_001219 [Penicillium paradoxum]KAJ5794620.1 hypothetical protein N7457_001219 [Penicillium paradoxum]
MLIKISPAVLQAKLADADQQRNPIRSIDLHEVAAINRVNHRRGTQIEQQFEILEMRLQELADDLDNAKGKSTALESLKKRLSEECNDWFQLRQAVNASEFNRRQQQVRFADGQSFLQELMRKLPKMHSNTMQGTTGCQVSTASALINNPVSNSLYGAYRLRPCASETRQPRENQQRPEPVQFQEQQTRSL